MNEWQAIGVVSERQPIDVAGVDPWRFEWRRLPVGPIELPHPTYPGQRHSMVVYEAGPMGRVVTFAAGELSANVWAFYVPTA